jgi:hypothetical protein
MNQPIKSVPNPPSREQFEQWISSSYPELDLDWNESKHTYYGRTVHLMFQSWLQASVTNHLLPPRKRKSQKPFSPAVKARLQKRYRQKQDERFAQWLPHIKESILAGRTLREMESEIPFAHSAIHKYILRNEELNKLWTGDQS